MYNLPRRALPSVANIWKGEIICVIKSPLNPQRNKICIFLLLLRCIPLLFLLAFLLLDYGLEKRGIEDWKRGLWYNENGKPYLAEGQGIYFNLSHSGEYVACAVSGEEVGCDIELISGQKPDIARRFFSPSINFILEQSPIIIIV